MKSFRAMKETNGFICGNGRMAPTKMITRVTWDDKGCTVSIQHGDLQFTTDFTPVLKEMLQYHKKYASKMKRK